MMFLGTLLSTVTLIASGVSASPLGERSILQARVPTQDYAIDPAFVTWMQKSHTHDLFRRACSTVGGWEPWAQLELEHVFKQRFHIGEDVDIREQSKVFRRDDGKAMFADFLLPKTNTHKGMIIELKCENKLNNKGHALKPKVEKDKAKQYHVKPEYFDHTFIALAMAYTPEAQRALSKIGMKPIPGAEHKVPSKGTMKVFKEHIPSARAVTAEMEDLTNAFENLFKNTDDKKTSGSKSSHKKTGEGSGHGKTREGSGHKKTTGSGSGKGKKKSGPA